MAEQFADQEEQDPITKTALAIYSMGKFRSSRDYQHEPKRGTVVYKLWQEQKLTLRHQKAWSRFRDDLYNHEGKSGKVVATYGEGIGGGNGERTPVAYVSREYEDLQRCCATMTPEEKMLLRDMMDEELHGISILRLEVIGYLGNGYEGNGQARSSGVTRVTTLLERIAAYYGL